MRLGRVFGVAGFVVVAAAYPTSVFAQESSPPHLADIRVGKCANLGEVVAPLAPLVVPEGEPHGQAGATPVQQSVTEVPLPLMDLLSASHVVAVQASPEQISTPIACGEIGGALDADGTLAVGLQGMNGAKMSGIAAFAPTAAGDGTAVTVLLVDERSGRDRGDDGVDTGNDVVDGVEDAVDGADAADGVGNVTVGPAPDPAGGADDPGMTDGTDAVDGTNAHDGEPGLTSQPGEDGAVDRPGRGSDGGNGGRGGDGDRDHGSKGGDGGAARAGEDGSSSG